MKLVAQMLQKGQAVICIDDKEVNVALKKDETYCVTEFIYPDKCIGELADHPAEWVKNGGRVEVDKYPDCY